MTTSSSQTSQPEAQGQSTRVSIRRMLVLVARSLGLPGRHGVGMHRCKFARTPIAAIFIASKPMPLTPMIISKHLQQERAVISISRRIFVSFGFLRVLHVTCPKRVSTVARSGHGTDWSPGSFPSLIYCHAKRGFLAMLVCSSRQMLQLYCCIGSVLGPGLLGKDSQYLKSSW